MPPQKKTRFLDDPFDIDELIAACATHFEQDDLVQVGIISGDETQFLLCSSAKHLSISDCSSNKSKNFVRVKNSEVTPRPGPGQKVKSHGIALVCFSLAHTL